MLAISAINYLTKKKSPGIQSNSMKSKDLLHSIEYKDQELEDMVSP